MRACVAFAAVVLGACVLQAPPAPAVATPPAGWRPLFATDFSGAQLPEKCRAYEGPQGGTAASYYQPDEVAVADGLLRLSMRQRTVGDRQYTTGGIGCEELSQTYGRYEFRAKAPLGAGIDSYITLWPAEPGNDKDATLIELLARPGNEKAYLTNQYGAGASHVTASGDLSGGFHTYTIEWAPTFFRILIDGTPRLTDSHISIKRKWIGFAVSSGDPLTGVPDASTALPAEFQIDFLRVYAYDPLAEPIPGAQPAPPPGTADTEVTAESVILRFAPAAFAVTAAVVGVTLTIIWYARLRARRLRPAHRA